MTNQTNTKEYKATAKAHPNIAIAKYWGKRDEELNLPFFDSVGFTLDGLTTETTAIWDEGDFRDALVINHWNVPEHLMGRIKRILDEIRTMAELDGKRCVLQSKNNFPLSSGLASSASGCAAAAAAASAAAGLHLSTQELSCLARLGSGSAARCIAGGWTRWLAGCKEDGSDSYAVSIAPANHWPLCAFVVCVSEESKSVSSTDAMKKCQYSPYWPVFLEQAKQAADFAQNAILQKDFAQLTEAMHENMMQLHALAMTCHPPIFYMAPKSIELLQHIFRLSQALQVCCTMDAGSNVVVLCEEIAYPFVKNEIMALGVPFIQCQICGGVSVHSN